MDSLHDLYSLSELYRLRVFVSEELFSTLQPLLHRQKVAWISLLYGYFPWKAFRWILLLISISSNFHVLIVTKHRHTFRIPLVVYKPLSHLLRTNKLPCRTSFQQNTYRMARVLSSPDIPIKCASYTVTSTSSGYWAMFRVNVFAKIIQCLS